MKMIECMKGFRLWGLFLLISYCGGSVAEIKAAPRNVLLLCVDDLRPVMGCYGGAAKTPQLDRFAERAAVFQRHYVQWPVCGPSRASMLGGLRPDSTGIYEIPDSGKIADRPVSHPVLPRYFKDHGYTTLSFGKIYHYNKNLGSNYGWSEPTWIPPSHWTCYVDVKPDPKKGRVGPCYEMYDGPDRVHNDYKTADQVIDALARCKGKPFFIAGGFSKPHLPFVAPKRYWDLYAGEEIKPPSPNGMAKGGADYTYSWTELNAYSDPEGTLYSVEYQPDGREQLNMIRAYYASVSFVDAQIGRILAALDELGLAETTAVVVWGDHGFHLGDHARWAKHTQFEQSMRSPLMMRLPGAQSVYGNIQGLAESVDLYPTLCEYAGLNVPEFADGVSLIAKLNGGGDPREAAFSQIHPVGQDHQFMAYSVRTDRFRYVEWRNTEKANKLVARELYDHRNDPEETINVADHPEFAAVLAHHAAMVEHAYTSLQKRMK